MPIYGVGGLLLYFFLHSYRKKPFRVFIYSSLICAVLEYLTSYFLEQKWGIRWWDYSGHFLNINGRICLLGVVAFGLGGVGLICGILPLFDKVYKQISGRWRRLICVILILIFVADAAWCAMHPNFGTGISQEG